MKLFYYRGAQPNFGDELNPWLWPQIFGSIFDDDASSLFLGIGSILYDNDAYPRNARKIVFGAGFGAFGRAPDVGATAWDVYFVRGPRTARALGLDADKVVTDAAILLHSQWHPSGSSTGGVAFIPHYQSLERGNWRQVCEQAGIRLIDPTEPVETVVRAIERASVVITEALHGAIVADTLRVPWIPVLPIDRFQRFKWSDWTDSLELPYEPATIAPSSLREHASLVTGRSLLGNGKSRVGNVVAPLFDSRAARRTDKRYIDGAARRLQEVATGQPSLSKDRVFRRALNRTTEMVTAFAHDVGARP